MLAAVGRSHRKALTFGAAVVLTAVLTAGTLVLAESFRGKGSHRDQIVGTNRADHLDGHAGDDTIRGLGGGDVLRGGRGGDDVDGGKGNDAIRGQKGNDTLTGGTGNDSIFGGRGHDLINITGDGMEVDGAGNDVIHARDGTTDGISCGGGRDKAIVDRTEDGVFDCETIVEPR
jgi:RTX calcium-binding nonapeptide repeat (4 copies)